jgi:hypothetical protein
VLLLLFLPLLLLLRLLSGRLLLPSLLQLRKALEKSNFGLDHPVHWAS